MIKMSGILNTKRQLFFAVGILSLAVLTGALLTNGVTRADNGLPAVDRPSVNVPDSVKLTTFFASLDSAGVILPAEPDSAISVGPLLGYEEVFKVEQDEGALVKEIVYYVQANDSLRVLATVLASHAWEADVNVDGSREIIYTFGSPGPNVRIIAGTGDVADLNSAFNAPSVEYNAARNDFEVTYPNSPTYRYSFQPQTMILNKITP